MYICLGRKTVYIKSYKVVLLGFVDKNTALYSLLVISNLSHCLYRKQEKYLLLSNHRGSDAICVLHV